MIYISNIHTIFFVLKLYFIALNTNSSCFIIYKNNLLVHGIVEHNKHERTSESQSKYAYYRVCICYTWIFFNKCQRISFGEGYCGEINRRFYD